MNPPEPPSGGPTRRPPLRPDMTVRQIAADYPGCQDVFLRHGEPAERPTKFGHLEPLTHFARRMKVPLEPLLAELAGAAGVAVDHERPAARRIHRPFVAWALAITLTLGAGWGAWLLFAIAAARDFAGVPAAEVVAHGEAQLGGFLALFILGIALSYLPRVHGGAALSPRFGSALLALVLAGTGGGFVWALAAPRLAWLGPASGGGLLLAALLYLAFLLRLLAPSWRTTWARFMLASGLWLVVWACLTLALRIGTAETGPGAYTEEQRLALVELAVFGFALNSIYGFGQKLLSGFLGSATPRRGWIECCFWLHNAGLLLPVRWNGVASALLLAGAACYAIGLRGFRRVRHTPTRPEIGQRFLDRYVQLAFFWLLMGLLLLVAGDLRQTFAGETLPHAYFGAVRHALTVGFITTLILGVGQRLLPILQHTLLAWPRLVAPIFVLIATGNLLRVATELATPSFAPAFWVMPLSSILELAALALFAINVAWTLWPAPDPLLRRGQATARTPVALLLAEHPWLEDSLFAWGLAYIGRVRSVPGELTLGTLAASEGKEPADILTRINEQLAAHCR